MFPERGGRPVQRRGTRVLGSDSTKPLTLLLFGDFPSPIFFPEFINILLSSFPSVGHLSYAGELSAGWAVARVTASKLQQRRTFAIHKVVLDEQII